MEDQNKSVYRNTSGVQQTTGGLETGGTQMNEKASFLQKKEEALTRHVEQLSQSKKTWISRLALSKDQKMLLHEYAERQQDALNIVLTNQNKSLAAICGGQTAFVKELVNTLVVTSRASLKTGANAIFNDLRVQRAFHTEQKEREFYDLIEAKFVDAANRHPKIQEVKLRQIDFDLKKWEEDYNAQ